MNSCLIMIFFFLEIIVIAGIILDAISNKEKIEYSSSLSSLVFMACNIGMFVVFNPFLDEPYLGVFVRVFSLYTHAPLCITYAITSLYKSIKHVKYFPGKLARILISNVALIFLLSIVNVLVLFRGIKEIYILIFLQGLFQEFNSYFGCLKEKEFENYNNKRKKMILLLTMFQMRVT